MEADPKPFDPGFPNTAHGMVEESRRPELSVGVMVDLEWKPEAGGHVKCWERFAEAACSIPEELDLTVHFLGQEHRVIPLAENVRYVLLPPVFSTSRLPFLNEGPGHTDLFPRNSALREYLPRYDVLHITDPFTLCRTAAGYAQKHGVPLVKSVHTHLPEFTRVYSTEMLKKFSGGWSALEWLLLKQLRLHDRFAAGMARRLEKLVRRCDAVLVSDDRYRDWTRQVHPDAPLFSLRRGIDKERFHPRHANREGLRQLGVPANKIILLFVGRVDDSKNVMTVARATRALVDQGHPVHLIVAGEGARRREVRDLLGRHVTAPGMLPQEKLNWLYASSDLFAFPSQSETFGNVMLEARASGCPVMVPASSLSVRFVEEPGFDGFLVEDCEPESWFRALEPLVQNPALLARAGEAAWQRVQRQWPSWLDVVREDLLPVWRDMAEIGTEFQVPAETTLPSSSRKKFKAA